MARTTEIEDDVAGEQRKQLNSWTAENRANCVQIAQLPAVNASYRVTTPGIRFQKPIALVSCPNYIAMLMNRMAGQKCENCVKVPELFGMQTMAHWQHKPKTKNTKAKCNNYCFAGKSIRNRWQMTAEEEVCPLAKTRHWKWQPSQIASYRYYRYCMDICKPVFWRHREPQESPKDISTIPYWRQPAGAALYERLSPASRSSSSS